LPRSDFSNAFLIAVSKPLNEIPACVASNEAHDLHFGNLSARELQAPDPAEVSPPSLGADKRCAEHLFWGAWFW
jgi:hypothetical protein